MKKNLTALLLASTLSTGLLAGQALASEVSGTFNGSAEGRNGAVTVAVTLDGGVITQVDVLEHEETDGVGTLAFDQLTPPCRRASR